MPDFPLTLEQASTIAPQLDQLYYGLWIVTIVFFGAVLLAVFIFSIKYRRRSEFESPKPILGSLPLEITWSLIPLVVFLGIFFWSARLYYNYGAIPANAMEIYVTGRQWMWHTQHQEGQREINELHIPIGRPVKLTMASEDVIHSFFIPAFRLKRDVVPGRYSSMWFEATKPGTYHLFCAEYCGSKHSGMGGWIYAMEPAAYDAWLAGTSGGGMDSLASKGQKVFGQYGCASCHRMDAGGRCPLLVGVYGSRVLLNSGQTVVADEAYIRESILNPAAKITYGYANIMPPFQGQLSEEQLLQLVAYIKSLNSMPFQNGQGSRDGSNVIEGGYNGQENFNYQGARPKEDNSTRFRSLDTRQE